MNTLRFTQEKSRMCNSGVCLCLNGPPCQGLLGNEHNKHRAALRPGKSPAAKGQLLPYYSC